MPAKIPFQHIKESFKQKGYVVLDIKRVDGRCNIEYICPNNHRSIMRWDGWKRGSRCPHCFGNAKLTDNFIKCELKKERYEMLFVEYLGNSRKIRVEYICPEGHRHNVSWGGWKIGNRCPYCSGNDKKTIEFVRSEFAKEDYVLLTKEYYNAHQKLYYICPKDHRHSVSWSKWRVGYRCAFCNMENLAIKYCGQGNPAWKGGISCEPYCDVWLDKEFKEFIKERDNYTCQNPDCREINGRLSVHHIDYVKKNCQPENLITICNSCNSRANKNRELHTSFYQTIMNKKYGYCYEQSSGSSL